MCAKVRRRTPSIEKAIFVGDVHCPHQDPDCVRLFFSFLRYFEPNYIFLIGDILDFYALSRYDKHPVEALRLQKEIDEAKSFIHTVRKACPDATIKYRGGNHEERLEKYLRSHPELYNLNCLSMEHLLDLDEVDIEYYQYRQELFYRGLCVEHGDRVRNRSAYTAASMLDKRQQSGIIGHTHRMGVHYRTTSKSTNVWFENGCLAQKTPEYIMGTPDWQHGFTVSYYVEKIDQLFFRQIPIQDYKILYEGVLFEIS